MLAVAGSADLIGGINVTPGGGYTPVVGTKFNVLTATSITDNGFAFTGPNASRFMATIIGSNTLELEAIAATLSGDYHNNGVVDTADYAVWLNSLGQAGAGLAADGNGDMVMGQLDYDTWKTNFGNPGTGSGSISSVPEPSSSLMLLAIALVGFLLRFSRVN